MSRPITKTGQVSLQVGEDIASLLGPMVNASEFIRRAILAHAGCRCPLCLGHGFVPMGNTSRNSLRVLPRLPARAKSYARCHPVRAADGRVKHLEV